MFNYIAVSSRANNLSPFVALSAPKAQAFLPLSRFKSRVHQVLDSLLQRCSSMKQLKQLHAQLITNALIGETLTVAHLVAFCAVSGAGDLRYGVEVFERIAVPNRFMWNSLIRGYSNSKNPKEAIFLLRKMMSQGLLPNQFTLPFVLKSCTSVFALEEAIVVHGIVFKLGFGSQIFVLNALLHAYSSCGSIELARKLFVEMHVRNVVSWNSMIGGYSQLGNCEEAFTLFRKMIDTGLLADEFTLVILLSACSQAGNLKLGRLMHHHIEMTAVKVDLIVGNALVDMYGKCGELFTAQTCFDRMDVKNVVSRTSMVCAYAKHGYIEDARRLFDQMAERNIVSWNAMISCYVQHGLCQEALDLYTHMQASKVVPDEITLIAVLSASSQNGNLVIGKKVHDYVNENIENSSVALVNSLVDMYAKCGPIEIALDLFSTIPNKSTVSWNVIIGALAMHGRALDAVEFFKCMVSDCFLPDEITFVGLLSACSHGGLVEAGQYYFESMSLVYRVPHEIEHYACMVDLFGRGGHLQRAVELISSMPMKPDIVIWGALLGACRIHGNVMIGNQVIKQLLELEPSHGGLHVLISNIYCETQRWEGMKMLRKLMRKSKIKKDTGTSSIEINEIIHEFVVEDMRHESSNNIYILLTQLTDHMMYVEQLSIPSVAFFDIEE
ncbi:pentatricopeptide repeat-containing protein At2g22410, mitochondrial-like [Typha latifolia]|uniref:pentatricopeptide repeat-containing protein At2g22410, mitochondrial-like n=1 Tax=Typha latifolia TaxID=4733 RepID=UPI003C2E0F63